MGRSRIPRSLASLGLKFRDLINVFWVINEWIAIALNSFNGIVALHFRLIHGIKFVPAAQGSFLYSWDWEVIANREVEDRSGNIAFVFYRWFKHQLTVAAAAQFGFCVDVMSFFIKTLWHVFNCAHVPKCEIAAHGIGSGIRRVKVVQVCFADIEIVSSFEPGLSDCVFNVDDRGSRFFSWADAVS